MKTHFKISPRFPIESELVKDIVRFAISEAKSVAKYRNLDLPKNICFRIKLSKIAN
jgi:hypothetical protein